MRDYKLRPRAKDDLDRIWEQTSDNWGRAQARLYLGKIKHACRLIANNPYIGRSQEEFLAGLHVFTVEKHMLCYFIDEDKIDVLRILHRRMDVESHIW